MSERTVAWEDVPAGTVMVAVGRISCGGVVVYVVVSLVTTFVFKTSDFLRRPLFRGCHPRLEMAHLFGCTLAKDCFHALLTIGSMSDVRIFTGMPIMIRNWESFFLSRVVAIFQLPFCLAESPTCQWAVPFGTPIHTFHSCSTYRTYRINGNWNWLPCPSSSRKGSGPPSVQGNRSRESMRSSIALRSSDVMPPLGLQQTNGGTTLPRKLQVGAPGYRLPGP
jgi:hypothetical protein